MSKCALHELREKRFQKQSTETFIEFELPVLEPKPEPYKIYNRGFWERFFSDRKIPTLKTI
jgi:hypothetical protein